MDKIAIRREMTERLMGLSREERAQEDCKIYQNVIKLDEFKFAKTIFAYISVGAEAGTIEIVREALIQKKRVAVPKCLGKGIMHAVEITELGELCPDKYDIPSAPDGNPIIDAREIDLILVPGIAFDKAGNRLGRGGGYYDRYLACAKAKTVGICRAVQLIPQVVRNDHDMMVDVLITPDQIFRREDSRPE